MQSLKDIIENILKKKVEILLDDTQTNIRVRGNISTLTAEDKANIKNRKSEIIQLMKLSSNQNTSTKNSIPKIAESDCYEVSDGQRRTWVISQMNGASASYNVPFYVNLPKTYSLETLTEAFRKTIERHEILRTTFKLDDQGDLKQFVSSMNDIGFSIAYKDFSQEDNWKQQLISFMEEDALQSFDLALGPLMRIYLIKTDETSILYGNIHHSITDGWSNKILFRDVLEYANAIHTNETPKLPPVEVQYKDYVAWQLSQKKSKSYLKQKTFWEDQLSGELPLLDVFQSQQRPAVKTFLGQRLKTVLFEEQSDQLRAFSKSRQGTLFMGLLSSLNILLYRYTASQDIVIGSPVSGRSHPSLQNQIGFYVNTLVFRNQIEEDANFGQVFDHIKATTLEIYQHQDYPFDALMDDLDVHRDISRNPLFDIMLVVDSFNNDINPEKRNHKSEEILEESTAQSKFDLLFTFVDYGEGQLSFQLEYNQDVYTKTQMKDLIYGFRSLIDQLLQNPSLPVKNVDFMPDVQCNKVYFENNQTVKEYASENVLELLYQQAKSTPKELAVVFENQQFTYQEVENQSNQLAYFLQQTYKANPAMNIGVGLKRSAESVIVMLGVLKSGACYVPVDYSYPESRVEYILNDAEIDLILSTNDLKAYFNYSGKEVLDIHSLSLEDESTKPLEIVNQPQDPSFIIYTSGSTGKPKGVVQTHEMLNNLIQWDIHDSGLPIGARHLQYASFSFDASLHDALFVLSSGGSLFVASEEERTNPIALKELVLNSQLEVLSFPYAALVNFFNHAYLDEVPQHHIKYIVSTAEQLYISGSLDTFLQQNPTVEIHNHYGPSESHVVTAHYMSYQLGNIENRASIGKPISNTDIYILDAHLNLVPEGVKGEVFIGGKNLALGYMNLPERTSERFIQSPFNSKRKLYKTGDIAYWRPDGNIEYLGRNDTQVKIRGYRIELKEIELALLEHTAIESAAVVLWNHQNEDHLCGYYLASEELSPSQLRTHLKRSLPEYMIPSFYMKLDDFPLTSNDKLNVKLLPDPMTSQSDESKTIVPPENETEEEILELWKELFQQKNISIDNDFFDLGGHSLKAMKLVSMYYKTFDVTLTLQELFVNTTIQSQGQLIIKKSGKEPNPDTSNDEMETISF